MTQGKLKMIVEPEYHKNIDTLGDWDRTCCESFAYYVFGEDGYDVETMGGYLTEEKAREAGEKALKRLEGRA